MDRAKRAVLVGTVIGDGHLNVRTRYNGNTPYVSAALRVLHGPNQRAYCEWKAKRVGWALGGRQINVTKVKNGPGGKYDAYQFTVGNRYFQQLKGWMYPEGKKQITPRVLDMLNPEGLAIWYMDDGHARRNVNKEGYVSSVATNIATYCSEAEVQLLVDWLASEYGVVAKKRFSKHRNSWFIEMNTAGSHEFAGVIRKYVPECMMYKLTHVADFVSHERRTPVGACSKCDAVIYDKRRRGMCTKCYTRDLRAGDDIV